MNAANTDEAAKWFVRIQGRVMGPFDLRQLESLKSRGKLARIHEISTNRRDWQKASTLEALFPLSRQPKPENDDTYSVQAEERLAEKASEPAPPALLSNWYYAGADGNQTGPTTAAALQQLINQGQIGPDDMVWKDGFVDWVPARTVPELRFVTRPPSPMISSGWQQQSVLVQTPETSGLAVASLVLGVLWLGGLGSFLALIFGAIAMHQVKRSRGAMSGKGMAVAGLVLGIIGTIPAALFWLATFGIFSFSMLLRQ